jgi:hypothetical protein
MAIITNRYVVLILLLVAAVISFAFGVRDGVWLFVGLGMALEGMFWAKLFRKRRRYPS